MNEIKRDSNLLLCATPLHILIAEQIIEQNSNSDFDVILMMSENDNINKFSYYYNRIKKISKKSMLWKYKPKLSNLVKFKAYLTLKGFNKVYDKVYLSNMHRVHFQLLVSYNLKADIYTYDDGLGNIISSSNFYVDNEPDLIRKTVWSVLGVKVNSGDIKTLSKTHYTIYKNIPNIISKTELINLNSSESSAIHVEKDDVLKIYLGQPLEELDARFSPQYIKQALDKLGITHYFPHPRETVRAPSNVKVMNSKYIFEDYILKLIENHPSTRIEVYSFISSAIINIANIEGVKCFYIFDQYIFNKYSEVYQLADNFSNIELIYL